MKILLTGANGYIGMRLLPQLLALGHEVICCVRDKNRIVLDKETRKKVTFFEVDFLIEPDVSDFPKGIDVAYYLIHSMSASTSDFDQMEAKSARHFNTYMAATNIKQVIYLSGIVNDDNLSKHLSSRKQVEHILYEGDFSLTVLRAGIVVGSGSSSFEIIRDLCEKLPIMITPKWLNTKTQPIAIRNVIAFLSGVIMREDCFNMSFDIGGPNVLTYKQMLKLYAKTRKLRLFIITLPVMSPRLSAKWLYFVTSTSYKLATNLVDSMKMEVIAQPNNLHKKLGIELYTYVEAIEMAFTKIEQNLIISSWKDSMVSGRFNKDLKGYIQVPKFGVLTDKQTIKIDDPDRVLNNIWSIGGETGWYYGNWLWQMRGHIDKIVGGVGLRRGRTHKDKIFTGDSLDFWRVVLADKKNKRLLLYAEMKVPGEAWLEFDIKEDNTLHQIATFRPKGLLGRLYWYTMLPFHYFIFEGMIKNIAETQ